MNLNKVLTTLASAGIIAIVVGLFKIASVSEAQTRTVKMLDALELRVSANEIDLAVQKALDEERHKPKEN